METTIGTYLLITAAVVVSCIVVIYAVNIVDQTLNTNNISQLDRLKSIDNNLLNNTDNLFNGTIPQSPSQP